MSSVCSTALSVPCRTITSVLLRPLSRFRENSFRKGERERDRLLSLASGNNMSFIFASRIWLYTNRTQFIPLKSKPVIQPNKNLYTLEYMINFHLVIWRRKHSFYHLNQEGNKLQVYAIHVDILLIQTVYAFIVTLNHKLKITHLLELEGNWLILQTKGKKAFIEMGKGNKGVGNPGTRNTCM